MTAVHRRNRRLRRRTGFTLIEILCVVVILGIVAAMVIPEIGSSDDLRSAAGARTVMADLIFAQNQAINNQEYVYVSFDTSGQTYSLNDPDQPTENFTRSLGSGTGALAGCSLVSATFGSNATTIAYDPLGEPCAYSGSNPPPSIATNGSVVIASGSDQATISVEADTGELSVQ